MVAAQQSRSRGKYIKGIGTAFETRVLTYINDNFPSWTAERNPERDHFTTEASGKYDVRAEFKTSDYVQYIECKKTTKRSKHIIQYKWLEKMRLHNRQSVLAFGFMRSDLFCILSAETYTKLYRRRIPQDQCKIFKGAKYMTVVRDEVEQSLPYFLYTKPHNKKFAIVLFEDFMKHLEEQL